MPFIRKVRAQLADRRAAHRAHRQLSDELAAFRTAAERNELDMILSRHTAEETREIHAILNHQATARRARF
jgi:hypothetical protein